MERIKEFTHLHATIIVACLICSAVFYIFGLIRSEGRTKILGAAKRFFAKLISDSSDASSKRFVMICSFVLITQAFIFNQFFGYLVAPEYWYTLCTLAGVSGVSVAHEGFYKSKNATAVELVEAAKKID